jgi:hypothetical protein
MTVIYDDSYAQEVWGRVSRKRKSGSIVTIMRFATACQLCYREIRVAGVAGGTLEAGSTWMGDLIDRIWSRQFDGLDGAKSKKDIPAYEECLF